MKAIVLLGLVSLFVACQTARPTVRTAHVYRDALEEQGSLSVKQQTKLIEDFEEAEEKAVLVDTLREELAEVKEQASFWRWIPGWLKTGISVVAVIGGCVGLLLLLPKLLPLVGLAKKVISSAWSLVKRLF